MTSTQQTGSHNSFQGFSGIQRNSVFNSQSLYRELFNTSNESNDQIYGFPNPNTPKDIGLNVDQNLDNILIQQNTEKSNQEIKCRKHSMILRKK